MAGKHWQAANLVASPSYPNSVVWSEDNLVAIASGHIITILNPALLDGPRGLITLPPTKHFPIGVVQRKDLLSPCLMPICLSRDTRPCARSISWSQPGFAPNYGCLLAVCTIEGRVKLYRPPFCEFCAEWLEVIDLSDLLHDHLVKINYGEKEVPETPPTPEQTSANSITRRQKAEKLQDFGSDVLARHKRKRTLSKKAKECDEAFGEEFSFIEKSSNNRQLVVFHENNDLSPSVDGEYSPCLDTVSPESSLDFKQKSKLKVSLYSDRATETEEFSAFPLITPEQYASRNSLLSALIVVWSPVFHLHESCLTSFKRWQILSVGSKSGNIYFWKVNQPKYYTIEHEEDSVQPILIGLLHAHNAWVTSISWEYIPSSSAKCHLFLATGSADGSLKLWGGDVEALAHSSDTSSAASFVLLKEFSTNIAPISIVSLIVDQNCQDGIVLTAGRTSGSLEAWLYEISSGKTKSAGLQYAHDQVVTGLTWAFDGGCLYSCSQDNSFCSWILHENCLHKVPFSSKFPSIKSDTDVSHVSDQTLGLAISPGQLMVAVVRTFDQSLLNQMYQARTQRAVVEFFWIGGQLLIKSPKADFAVELSSDLSEQDLLCWESSLLWSLKNFNNDHKHLVLWDVIEALQAFKKFTPNIVERLLYKWIFDWFPDYQFGGPLEKILDHAQSMLPEISSRKICLLNVICRRLMLSDVSTDTPNREQSNSNESNDCEGKLDIWHKLLLSNEYEQRQRLVAFTLKAILSNVVSRDFSINTCWFPVEVSQIQRWASNNVDLVHNQLKVLISEHRKLGSRTFHTSKNKREDKCCFCSAAVPFESPEFGVCEGGTLSDGTKEKHKLLRCAVSMQLCSIMSPMWFCICCKRSAANLAPQTFLMTPKSPLDVTYEYNSWNESLIPICPFCGILLQRSMPEFLLSIAPV